MVTPQESAGSATWQGVSGPYGLSILPDPGNVAPMTDDPRFIHLRVHTEYSLLEGAVPVKKLPGLCRDMGMPAVAVTDTNNMFAALEFSVTAGEQGVQPILGCQVDLKVDGDVAPIVLLAQNEAGYLNLLKLNSALYLGDARDLPCVTLEELGDAHEGLICLSGGPDGPVGRILQAGKLDGARALLERLAATFPDRLYVELQRHPAGDDSTAPHRKTERGHVELAYELSLPLVATNDVYFPKPEMAEAHDALICIAEGAYVDQQEPRRRLTPEHHLKTPAMMATLFADLPEAIENTVEIAQRCAFGAARRDPILTPESWARLHRPVVDASARYGMGWVSPSDAVRMHSGSNTIWFATGGFNAGGDAIAVVTNIGNGAALPGPVELPVLDFLTGV